MLKTGCSYECSEVDDASIFRLLNRKFNSIRGRLRSELLRSSNQQPPSYVICQMQSAPATNRTRHVESTTCARYCKVMSLTSLSLQLYAIKKLCILIFPFAFFQSRLFKKLVLPLKIKGVFTQEKTAFL